VPFVAGFGNLTDRGGAAEILTKHPSLIYFCRKEAWSPPLKEE
jgi:hypothetical protein